MKADLSRATFVPTKHYAAVLMQQGRVQLDADWNEQLGIQLHRDVTEAEDVIGECGAPKHEAGFLVQPTFDGKDLTISPGRFYVHGRLCELEATPVPATFVSNTEVTVSIWHVDGSDFAPFQYVELSAPTVAALIVRVDTVDPTARQLTFTNTSPSIAAFSGVAGLQIRRLTTYLTQPDLPDPPFQNVPGPGQPPEIDLPAGAYLVYLDVWPWLITALTDGAIREKALGGPDTATRIKTVWQVKLWPGPTDGNPLPADTDCDSAVASWDAMTAPSTGRLNARTKPGPTTDDPCLLPPGAGFFGLENQHYRIDVHEGGVLGVDPITFTWSRDNGSVLKAITPITSTTDFTVDTGPDDVLGLKNGQWVEKLDDADELNNVARDLFQFQIDPVTGAVTLPYPVDQNRHPALRRWDSDDVVNVPFPPVGDGWIDVESNIQVRFEPGTYRRGDYWLIPARTLLGDIEWPRDGAGLPVPQLRRGIRHEYCRIGVLHANGGLAADDCRTVFPPLSELKSTYTCCTFTVGDGAKYVGDYTLIQEAVNHLPAEGGRICLFPGEYVENVSIDGLKNVHITGCGRRSRVVSPAPGGGGAQPVFHVVASERVKIESLAIEAADSAPGILADGDDAPNRGIRIEKVSVTAAGDSGIKIHNSEDVAIERCHVKMTDENGGWPGIFLQAIDGSVRETVVKGAMVGMSPRDAFELPGSLAVSALQLAGGCERIRVHDNLFEGCTGQGITLGSMIEVGAQEGPFVGRRVGWVADRNDPCFPCKDPTTGDRPPIDTGGETPPTTLQSEGDLHDIDIRRNRIFDMGLDGIGVAHFFDLDRTDRHLGLIAVEDLTIVDNRIQRCVRRRFAAIPENMLDLMAYGGISLAMVEGLVIRDNRIEDLGFGGLLPTCGVFVMAGEGVHIERNQVLNAGTTVRPTTGFSLPGRRGGIHVVYARGLTSLTGGVERGPALEDVGPVVAQGLPGIRRFGMAAIVEENSVDVIEGEALSLGVIGPVSVISNHFTSRRPAAGGGAKGLANPLTNLGSLVSIANLGSGTELGGVGVNFGSFTHKTPSGLGTASGGERPARGTILFNDNSCRLYVPEASVRPAIVILTLDDVGFQDNSCECIIRTGVLPIATLVAGVSQRLVSNRFKETLTHAKFSALTLGILNMTVLNQANHCLWAWGFMLEDAPNQVVISAFQENYCPTAKRELFSNIPFSNISSNIPFSNISMV